MQEDGGELMAFKIGNISVCTDHGSGGTTISWNHTCAAGSNILIVTFGAVCTNPGYTGDLSVTYNGVAMTQKVETTTTVVSDGDTYYFNAGIFYLLNPPTGAAYTVQATMNYSPMFAHGSAGAVDAAGAHATQNGGISDATNKTLTLSSLTTEDLAIDVMSCWTAGGNLTPTGTGQVEMWDFPSVSDLFSWAASYIQVNGSSAPFNWTVPSEVKSLHAAAAFIPAAREGGVLQLGGLT